MTLDKTEATGWGVAIAAHIILIAILSFRFGQNDPPRFENPPMAVEIIAEAAPVATAPIISEAPPAARLGDPDSDEAVVPPPRPVVEPPKPVKPQEREAVREPVRAPREARNAPPRPARSLPTPERTTRAAAAPARVTPTPAARVAPAPARPVRDPRPSGALDGIAAGVARDARPNARAATPPAAQSAAEIRADIRVSINAEVRGPWNGCRVTGIDVDQLKTTIVFRLTETGGLERIASVNTSGVNDSNRPQLQRFEECARRAIQLAAPFANLPRENYSYWQTYTLDFDKR